MVLLLAGCATSDPYSVQGGKDPGATVQGTSSLETWIPFYDTSSTIESVDDKSVGMATSQLLLPAGHHVFKVSCRVRGALDETYIGSQTLPLDLVAGHQYKFVPEDPSEGSAVESNLALLNRRPSELQKFLLGASRECSSYAYDLSGGGRPYQELLLVTEPVAADWTQVADSRDSGHELRRFTTGAAWETTPMGVESESWSRVMYGADAHALYSAQSGKQTAACPTFKALLLADSPDDFTYELDGSSCPGYGKVELGRYLVDAYGIHRAAVLLAQTPAAPDQDAWLNALKAAKPVQP